MKIYQLPKLIYDECVKHQSVNMIILLIIKISSSLCYKKLIIHYLICANDNKMKTYIF